MPDLIETMRADKEEADRFDVGLPINNAGALAAVALRRNKLGVVHHALDNVLSAYRLGDVGADAASDEDVRLWEAAAASLWAIGAVAVDLERYDVAREVVSRQPKQDGYYATWLRHSQVMFARRASDAADDNVLALSAHQLRLSPGYGMTERTSEDRLRALCVFDHLALLVLAHRYAEPRINFYPSYAKYPAEYVEPTIVLMRREGELRSAAFPGSDEDLREVLRNANEMALYQAAQYRERGQDWQYGGFQDPRTWMFIREGGIWEDWPVH